MGLEGDPRQIDDLQRVERNGQRADADLQRRGGFRGHAPAHEILDRQAQNRQRLVDGRRLGVVAGIETQDALAGGQQHQAAPECAVEQRVAPVGAQDVERQHDAGAADVLQDFAVVARQRHEPLSRPLAGRRT